jgi:hypothetical protein
MDKKEREHIEKHMISCQQCCDYVVALNKVIHFPEGETLPELPQKEIKKASEACKIAVGEERPPPVHHSAGTVEKAIQFLKDMFSFNWIVQPMPAMVRAGAGALLVLLICTTTYFYYQQGMPPNVQMEVFGKTRILTRGLPTGETIEKIIREGETLFSNDFCRINFELDKDAYAYVLYYDSSGTLQQLFPDPSLGVPQKVQANRTYTIPSGQDKWFQLDDQKGMETVFIVASREPIRDFNETIGTIEGLGKEEIRETLESKAPVLKVLSFDHQ